MLLWRTMRRILVEFSIFWDCQLKSSYLIHSLRALGLSVLLKCFASFWSGSESKIISVVYQTRLAHLLKMCFHISLEVVDISKVLPHSLWIWSLSSRIALPIKGVSHFCRSAVCYTGEHHLMEQILELDVLSQRNRHKY